MDTEIEKRLKDLTPFAREQVDSTWLGGTSKQDWLTVGLLLETLEDLLVRFCEMYPDEGYGEWEYGVIFLDDKKNPIDALVDQINYFALRLEPTDQEKRDDAEVSAAC